MTISSVKKEKNLTINPDGKRTNERSCVIATRHALSIKRVLITGRSQLIPLLPPPILSAKINGIELNRCLHAAFSSIGFVYDRIRFDARVHIGHGDKSAAVSLETSANIAAPAAAPNQIQTDTTARRLFAPIPCRFRFRYLRLLGAFSRVFTSVIISSSSRVEDRLRYLRYLGEAPDAITRNPSSLECSIAPTAT